jgi:hypothetical protein
VARSLGLFAAWGLAGAGLAVGFVSLGPFALLPALALWVWLGSRGVGVEASGLPAAGGGMFFYIAYMQRDGPGWHCTTPDSVECGESADSRPWLALGVSRSC